MTKPVSPSSPTDLRQRMIGDMTVRGFCAKTRHDYLRIVSRFAAFLAHSMRAISEPGKLPQGPKRRERSEASREG
jgi:hypothetical protein